MTALGSALALVGALGLTVSATPAAQAAPATAASLHATTAIRLVFFRSPSSNIYCYVLAQGRKSYGRCDIMTHTYRVPPKPRSCSFDWGSSFAVTTAGKGRMRCISDSAYSHDRVLRYGQTLKVGPTRCVSRVTGMTCRNVHTRHGFTVARAKYRLF